MAVRDAPGGSQGQPWAVAGPGHLHRSDMHPELVPLAAGAGTQSCRIVHGFSPGGRRRRVGRRRAGGPGQPGTRSRPHGYWRRLTRPAAPAPRRNRTSCSSRTSTVTSTPSGRVSSVGTTTVSLRCQYARPQDATCRRGGRRRSTPPRRHRSPSATARREDPEVEAIGCAERGTPHSRTWHHPNLTSTASQMCSRLT